MEAFTRHKYSHCRSIIAAIARKEQLHRKMKNDECSSNDENERDEVNSLGESDNYSSSDDDSSVDDNELEHIKTSLKRRQLPTFPSSARSMWISSYEANSPSEDRSSSLINILLQPTSQHNNNSSLVRISLWGVFDGHGGGAVASYASEVLLPHIAANLAKNLKCDIVSRGQFRVCGEERRVGEIDFDGLLRSTSLGSGGDRVTDRKRKRKLIYDGQNNSPVTLGRRHVKAIDYRSPEPEADDFSDGVSDTDTEERNETDCDNNHIKSEDRSSSEISDSEASHMVNIGTPPIVPESDSNEPQDRPCMNPGTHSPAERALVEKSLMRSFLAVDEGWINSIDSSKIQTACVSGGRWNAGACALVACVIQKIDGSNGDAAAPSYPAMLYTAHCGDCRAVLASSACQRNDVSSDDDSDSNSDVSDSDDSSSRSISDSDDYFRDWGRFTKSQSLSSESESSDDDDINENTVNYPTSSPYMTFVRRPTKRSCRPSRGQPTAQIPSPSSNPPSHSTPSPLPPKLTPLTLTTDHNAYNPIEASLVISRTRNAPRAISPANPPHGIKRVAGSLAVTRALGDAYLKTPRLSFAPYKKHVPYITARPEVNMKVLRRQRGGGDGLEDRVLVLASDGVWERLEDHEVVSCIKSFYEREWGGEGNNTTKINQHQRWRHSSSRRRRERGMSSSDDDACLVSNMLICRVLNKVRLSRKMTLKDLLALPKGKARRSRHDDITACVVDLEGFVV